MTTKTLTATGIIREGQDGYSVWTHWSGVALDRPETQGVTVGPNRHLAERLKAAIDAGAVYEGAHVTTSNSGATYVSATRKILGRTLNADLRRLGF